MRSALWSRALVATLAGSVLTAIGGSPHAMGSTAPARVRPGAAVTIAGVHCKVGLLLHRGTKVFAGIPASCTALPNDEGKHQDGCSAATAPVGTPARISGARHQATLVYNSFTRMQQKTERDPHRCYYNDLALLKLKRSDAKRARGALAGLNSPKSVSRRAPASGSTLSSGSSTATAGSTTERGWLLTLSKSASFTASDVGTPFVQGGRLVGMLTQLPQGTLVTTPAGISNLYRAIQLMRKTPRMVYSHHHHRKHFINFQQLRLLKVGERF